MYGELILVDDLPGAFSAQVIKAHQLRRDELFSLVLSGGETARLCYERLAADSDGLIDWLSVNVYWCDERCVPPDSPDSNQSLGRRALLERVGVANAVDPMSCDEGPDAYQLRLGEVGKLDVIHLDLGPDGHTASLFPNSEALHADPGQLVARNVDPSGSHQYSRLTLTYSGLARARLILITVGGTAKRDAMQAVFDGADLPASHVRADRVAWLVDRDAAPNGA
jgi:6-phosphogluconolactonase